MATIDRPSSGVPFCANTAALVERLWRPIAVQRPAVRWGLAAAAFLAVGAASYWGAGSLSTSGVRYLASSKRFSSDDLLKVCHALDKQRIVYRIDDLKRVEVAGDQFDQAADVVAKLDLGQRPIDEIRDDSGSGSLLWDGPGEREQKEKLKLERMLERLISEQSGVLRAVVSINRPRPSTFAQQCHQTVGICVRRDRRRPRSPVPKRPGDPLSPGGVHSRPGTGIDHGDGPP